MNGRAEHHHPCAAWATSTYRGHKVLDPFVILPHPDQDRPQVMIDRSCVPDDFLAESLLIQVRDGALRMVPNASGFVKSVRAACSCQKAAQAGANILIVSIRGCDISPFFRQPL